MSGGEGGREGISDALAGGRQWERRRYGAEMRDEEKKQTEGRSVRPNKAVESNVSQRHAASPGANATPSVGGRVTAARQKTTLLNSDKNSPDTGWRLTNCHTAYKR